MKANDATFIHSPKAENIVSLATARAERSANASEAWERFIAARQRSMHTLDFRDAIEAGHAYRDFLELFVPGAR